ncbi:MAG TPA: hypothetical protein VND94_22550, partial [Terriglobia bacterium]|nr:hypothetical protein [Terriglobia bacterium]
KGPVRFRRGLAGSAMRYLQRMRPYGNPPKGVVVVCMVVAEMKCFAFISRLSPSLPPLSNAVAWRGCGARLR